MIDRGRFEQLSFFPMEDLSYVDISFEKHFVLLEQVNNLDEVNITLTNFFNNYSQVAKKLLSSSAVFLKINLTGAEPPENGRTTHPLFLKNLIEALHSIGVPFHNIIVGDSSVIGIDTVKAAKVAGIFDICKTYDVIFYNLTDGPFTVRSVSDPLRNQSIPIHDIFLQHDIYTINCAKIKTTYGSPVGFCVKNLKGIIPNETKLIFHLFGVQDSLVDLRKIVTCDLNILEGFPGSELGIPRECKMIGISDCDYLLDGMVSEIIGISYLHVPHLKILCEPYKQSLLHYLQKESVKSFQKAMPDFSFTVHGLDEMSAKLSIEIIDGKPCTSCIESFFKAAEKLSQQEKLPLDFTYILGQWHINTEWELYDSKSHIFVGSCAFQAPPISSVSSPDQNKLSKVMKEIEEKGVPIPGCPPTIDSIVSILRKIFDKSIEVESSDALPERAATSLRRSPVIDKWIESVPMQNLLTSQQIADVIKIIPAEMVSFNDLGRSVAMQCELIAAAICQQMNWDFLRKRIRDEAVKDPEVWNFDRLRNFSEEDINKLLNGYLKRERFYSEQRAAMIRSLSQLSEGNWQTISQVFDSVQTESNRGGKLLSILNKVGVFSEDPENKKTQVFVHSLFKSKLCDFDEESFLKPAVDYHIMRLYIRRGNLWHRIKPGFKYLRDNVRRLSSTTSALRAIVASALEMIAILSKCTISHVNNAEWWLGRTICSRENPDCDLVTDEALWLRTSFSECPYKKICYAHTCDSTLLRINEPLDISKFY